MWFIFCTQHFCYHVDIVDLPFDSFLKKQRNDSELHRFIDDNLQRTEEFNKDCNGKTNLLAEFLKTGTKFSVSEVFKVW